MKKHKSFIYFLLGIFIGTAVFGIYNAFKEAFNKDNGALFVNTCADLNGKEFTYKNIKHLKGCTAIYDENKYVKTDLINKETLNEYIQYAKSYENKGSDDKELRHIELRQDKSSPKYTWVCWLTYNKEDGTISANALYTPDWASYQDTFIQYNSTFLNQD